MTDLFNNKTIDRHCATIPISEKQEDFAKQWFRLLQQNKLRDEVSNYPIFSEIILEGILGYDRREIKYEKDNIEFTIEDPRGKKILCIEAKGTKTIDLTASQHRTKSEHSTPLKQTWDHMGEGYEYGICTNYKHFILLLKKFDRHKYHLFNFESICDQEGTLNLSKLKEFVGIFSKKQIFEKKFIEKLQKHSETEQTELTDEFYLLYHETRLMLIKKFEQNGMTKSHSIYGAQLLLNRFIFIFFVQDKELVDKLLFRNAVLDILNTKLTKDTKRVWNYIKDELFHHFNKGSFELGKSSFNGGLFNGKLPDSIYFNDLEDEDFFHDIEIQKNIESWKFNEQISNIVNRNENTSQIIKNLLKMDSYDFMTEISVNILGHIFEQSISDIEKLKDKEISQRRIDGVYYTPEYITEYICKNTIIPHLSMSNNIHDVDELIHEYDDDIEKLEEKIISLKILDPACGSGAFLVKVVDILLEIYKEIHIKKTSRGSYMINNEIINRKKKKNKTIIGKQINMEYYSDEDNIRNIIKNNICGVDVNSESVEISKLALFLKTVSLNNKLPDLSKNIKMGNSIVDDVNIEKSFDWRKTFKEIFDRGGFDIIIGNPPYIRIQRIGHDVIDHISDNYESAYKKFDISLIFFEKGIQLLKKDGIIGFIASSQWMNTDYGHNLRHILSKKKIVKEIVDFGSLPVFPDASTYPAIYIFENNRETFTHKKIDNIDQLSFEGITNAPEKTFPISKLNSESWNFDPFNLIEHMKSNRVDWEPLSNFGHFHTGVLSGMDQVFVVDQQTIDQHNLELNYLIPYAYQGKEVVSYKKTMSSKMIIYPYERDVDNNTILISENDLKKNAPNILKYLESHRSKLEHRKDSRKYYAKGNRWYTLLRPSKFSYIESEKIIMKGISKNTCAGFLDNHTAFNGANNPSFIIDQSKYTWQIFLFLFNSRIISYYLKTICPKKLHDYYRFNTNNLNKIPIISSIDIDTQKIISDKVDHIIYESMQYEINYQKIIERMKHNINVKMTKNLSNLTKLDFNMFLNELKKQNITLALNNQDEWQKYLNDNVQNLTRILTNKQKIIDELNKIIYDIYSLSDDDIKIIEKSTFQNYPIVLTLK